MKSYFQLKKQLLEHGLTIGVLLEQKSDQRLWAFDFDDTLAISKGKITVRDSRGRAVREVPSDKYKSHRLGPGEGWDFEEFSKSSEGIPIKKWMRILKKVHNRGDNYLILTARAGAEGVRKFLEKHGIEGSHVVAVGVRTPVTKRKTKEPEREVAAREKSKVLMSAVKSQGFREVILVDDDEANIRAAEKIRGDLKRMGSRLVTVMANSEFHNDSVQFVK